MKRTSAPAVKERPDSSDLVKKLITLLPLKLTSDKKLTQQYAASLIGCHRHWFRRHKGRYNIQTGLPDQRGITPQEMLQV